MSTADLQAYAAQAAQANNVPVNMFLWQIGQESSWNPNAVNGSHVGLGQIGPAAAQDTGLINATDPYQNLDAAAKYDAMMYKQTGNWQDALTKYGTLANVGPQVINNFNNALAGAPQTPQQAMDYYNQNGYAYTPPAAAGSTAEQFQTTTQNMGSSIAQYFNRGTFVLLGIVVIAVAILSNKQVQTAVVKAAKA
jgi:hypothetical protein